MVLTKLHKQMIEKQVSAVELADKTIMSVRSIDNAKKGRGVSLGTCKRIAAGMKMKLEDLI